MKESGVIKTAAERITNAALWSKLNESRTMYGKSELVIIADELRVFLTKEEAHREVIPTLTRFFMCPEYVKNETKTSGIDYLEKVCVNILGATTPTDLALIIPGAATGSGFTPRLHIVRQEKPRKRVADPTLNSNLKVDLMVDLKEIDQLKGPFKFSTEGHEWWIDWYENKFHFPAEELLNGWYGRKHDYMLKLSMILSASLDNEMIITPQLMQQALTFLDQLEVWLSDAYTEIGRSESTKYFDRVLKQIEKRGGVASKSELLHDNWSVMDRDELNKVLESLFESERVGIEREGKTVKYKVKKSE